MLKRGRIDKKQVHHALSDYRLVPVEWMDVNMHECVTSAHQYAIYAYDAYVLQCARESRQPLLTLDKQMQRVALQSGLKILEV